MRLVRRDSQCTFGDAVLSAASEASRSRLRAAQVLAFCFALHDRVGADTAARDMLDTGILDIWERVAAIVHTRQGHEALCSTLACHNSWYEVCVRGLNESYDEIPEDAFHLDD